MGLFQEIEGSCAVLVRNGIFKQVPVATRDGYIYAKYSGGYVRLMADGATSTSKVRVDHVAPSFDLHADKLGRLCTFAVPGSTPLHNNVLQIAGK